MRPTCSTRARLGVLGKGHGEALLRRGRALDLPLEHGTEASRVPGGDAGKHFYQHRRRRSFEVKKSRTFQDALPSRPNGGGAAARVAAPDSGAVAARPAGGVDGFLEDHPLGLVARSIDIGEERGLRVQDGAESGL